MRKVIVQAVKEFGPPFFISLAWVFYSFSGTTFNLKGFISLFVPTFFLCSWVFSQYYRISKQNRVENNFEKIETRTNEIIAKIEHSLNSTQNTFKESTVEIINNLTGGDSVAFLRPVISSLRNNECETRVQHCGKYFAFDVKGYIIDFAQIGELAGKEVPRNFNKTFQAFKLGDLLPGFTTDGPTIRVDTNSNKIHLNVFYTARNGSYIQFIRMEKVNQQWKLATQVKFRDREEIIFERIDLDFPKNSSGTIDWNNATEKSLETN